MAFDLNEFRNKLTHGGARPNQFEMQITWPDAVRGAAGVSAAERDFRFMCQVSEIPAAAIGGINVMYFGRQMKYAGDTTFEQLTLTVLNDEDFKIRRALETWKRAIQEHARTTSDFNGSIAAGGYATDGIVTQYSRNSGGAPIQAYKFVGMFPRAIGAIALDWKTTDEIESFTVTFDYQWWETVDPTTGTTV